MTSGPTEAGGTGPRLDTGVAHSARVWNYLLREKDNFAAAWRRVRMGVRL